MSNPIDTNPRVTRHKVANRGRWRRWVVPILIGSLSCTSRSDEPQTGISEEAIRTARDILRQCRETVEKTYYDPKRLGNLAERCAEADRAIAACKDNEAAVLLIAQVFLDLNDSGTRFEPTQWFGLIDHHWSFHTVGNGVFVSQVDPGSDAERQGLRKGDQIHGIEGMAVRPSNQALMEYLIYRLTPRRGLRVIAQAPGGEPREVWIQGEPLKEGLARRRGVKRPPPRRETWMLPDGLLVWRLPYFVEDRVKAGLKEIGKASHLVLDLRGTDSGQPQEMDRLLRPLMSGKFQAYQMRGLRDPEPLTFGRTVMEFRYPEVGTIRGTGAFKGRILVLVDRGSKFPAEIVARTLQLRSRGMVLGDLTPGVGSLSTRRTVTLPSPPGGMMFMQVTAARVVMADGRELEEAGVVPDEVVIPTHEQLYRGHDPVLARALALLGHPTTAEEAGRLIEPAP